MKTSMALFSVITFFTFSFHILYLATGGCAQMVWNATLWSALLAL